MKATLLISLMLLSSLQGFAQDDDDMYFVPGKSKPKPVPERQVDFVEQTEFYNGNNRDVDEYNRRGTNRSTDNDTLYLDEQSEDVYADNYSQSYGNSDYDGYGDNDFRCSRRIYFGFSPYAYYADPFFYSPVELGYFYGWNYYSYPFYHNWYGFGASYYDPWYGFGGYYPHYRPLHHSNIHYYSSRPSIRYREGTVNHNRNSSASSRTRQSSVTRTNSTSTSNNNRVVNNNNFNSHGNSYSRPNSTSTHVSPSTPSRGSGFSGGSRGGGGGGRRR